jgi:2-dehydropantoate 2-reductase
MRIVILGAGAMGCLFAARLAPLTPVTLLSQWAEAIAQIRTRGIRLLEGGREQVIPVPISDDPAQAIPANLALILVKSYQTDRAAAWAATALSQHGLALTLQNGLGNVELIATHVGSERAVQGVTSEGATLLEPGRVRHGGAGLTVIGRRENTTARLEEVATLFRLAGFKTQLVDAIDEWVWGKLVTSAGINPLSALLGVPNGMLVKDESARGALHQTVEEAAYIAAAKGISLPYTDPIRQAEEICRATATNLSSMLQDLQRRRPTEVNAINGAVIRTAAMLNLKAPVNTLLWHLVKARETCLYPPPEHRG